MTIWDGAVLLVLLVVTVILLKDQWWASKSPDPNAAPPSKQPPFGGKVLFAILFFGGFGFGVWHFLQDPMMIAGGQRWGIMGPRGPMIKVHHYTFAVIAGAFLFWVVSGLLSKSYGRDNSDDAASS